MKKVLFLIIINLLIVSYNYCEDINITSISASSTLNSTNDRYSVYNLISRNDKSWVEGVNGSGIGESITIVFDSEKTLNEIYIKNGYGDFQYYFENNRVKMLRFEVDDRGGGIIVLRDKPGFQLVKFDMPIKTKKIKFIIMDIYKGTKYDDTCLSEISFDKWSKLNHTLQNKSIIEYHKEKIMEACKNYIESEFSVDTNKIVDTRHEDKAIYSLINSFGDYESLLPLQDGSVNIKIKINIERLNDIYNLKIIYKNILIIICLDNQIIKINQKILPNMGEIINLENYSINIANAEYEKYFYKLNLKEDILALIDSIENNKPWKTNLDFTTYDGVITYYYYYNAKYYYMPIYIKYFITSTYYQYITIVNYP